MKTRTKRTSLFTIIVVVLLFGALAAVIYHYSSRNAKKIPQPTTYSTHSMGLKALYLVLGDTGRSVRRLQRDYEHIPEDAGVIVLADPMLPVELDEAKALRKWLEAGGVLVTSMPCDQPSFKRLGFAGPCTMISVGQRTVPVNSGPGLLQGVDAIGPANPRRYTETPREFILLVFKGEAVDVGVASVGQGAIYVLPIDTIFTNGALKQHDNLRLAYNLFTSLDQDAVIYFDEYHQGYNDLNAGPGRLTMLHALFGTPYGLFAVQVALAALLFLLNRSGIKKRPHRMNLSATPLAFAGAAAGLYRRSGAHARSAARMIRIARRDLVRRRGLPPDTPLKDIADLFDNRDERRKVLLRLAQFQNSINAGGSVSSDQAVTIARDIAYIHQSFEEPSHAEL